MQTKFRVASFNIGGAITGASHQSGATDSIQYYADLLGPLNPDVLMLQEVTGLGEDEPQQVQHLARELGLPNVAALAIGETHLVQGGAEYLAAASRFEILGVEVTQLPNPRLSYEQPSGEMWRTFDKAMLTVEMSVDEGVVVRAVTGHMFPIHYFGAHVLDRRFEPIWLEVNRVLSRARRGGSQVVCGFDLNTELAHLVLADALSDGYRVIAPIADTATTSSGALQDYILCSADVSCVFSAVVPTESDHHCLVADVVLESQVSGQSTE